MKYLLVILVVLFVLWLMRSGQRRAPTSTSRRADSKSEPQPMLACALCGVHLPRDEALPGRGGVFCGEAHRTEYEKAHPPE